MEVKSAWWVGDHIARGSGGRVRIEVQVSVEADTEHSMISQRRYEEVLILAFTKLF